MKRNFLIIILFFSQFIFSQNLIQTNIQNKNVNDFILLEKKLGSKSYQSNEQTISFKDVEQPIIFEREEKEIPNLLVSYTCFKKDSTIAEILYEWDVYNFEKKDNNTKSLKFDTELIKKYKSIVGEISKKYGKSVQEGNLNNMNALKTDEGLKQSNNWKINDSLKINSYITLSEYYKKDGPITINPTHKIRVYVTNERTEKEQNSPRLSSEKITELDNNFFNFIDNLKKNDFESARNLLSEKIKNTASDEILKNLMENIQLNKNFENFMVGFQLLLDGKNHPMIQYKYTDDSSNPPNEYVTVIFENDGKIIGIKPMKMIN